MKFMTLQVPDSSYEFFKELMAKLNVKISADDNMVISEEQKELVRERIKTSKPENLLDIDIALSQIKFDEEV
ncbi:MAG: hypothetical protein JWO03_3501 [Bacteroidetes bacterium]|nr:hypothetical protein [Bacteroidota bacterium]